MATFNSPTDVNAGSLAKSSDINNLDAAITAAFVLLPENARLNAGTVNYVVDTGITDAYLVSMPSPPMSYTDGLCVYMRPITANTGACTINVDSLGVKAIKTEGNTTPTLGDIIVGVPVELRYSTATGFFHINKNAAAAAAAAAVSAVAALFSQNAAAASESASSGYASSAFLSKDTATAQASAAGISAAAALISQNAAAGSASAGLISQGAAAVSAAAALVSQNAALSSASTATTQAGNASVSAAAALVSENNTAALYDSFDDRYLGAKASDPTLDNDGNALLMGALYFNTVSNLMKVYTGLAWTALSLAIITAGLTTEILVGGGAGAIPVWTAAIGSGAPVRGTAPAENSNESIFYPAISGDLADTQSTQTLTNKTLTNPVVSNATAAKVAMYNGSKVLGSGSNTDAELADAVAKKHSNSLDHAAGSDNQDLSNLVVKVTGSSLVANTEIAKIHANTLDHSNSLDHAVGASIASSITDGDTTHSPDGNSVFDALALMRANGAINSIEIIAYA